MSASTSAGSGVTSSPLVARTLYQEIIPEQSYSWSSGSDVDSSSHCYSIIVVVIVMRCGQKPNSPGK